MLCAQVHLDYDGSMEQHVEAFELLLRGIAAGAMASWMLGVWRFASAKSVRVAALLLGVTAVAHVLENSAVLRGLMGDLAPAVNLLSLGATGFIWLFVVTLFEDRPISFRTLGPAVVLFALGFLAFESNNRAIWLVHKACEGALALHALMIVARTWRGDLVELRLRLRAPFVAMVSLYVMLMVSLQVSLNFGLQVPLKDLFNAAALGLLGLFGVAVFLWAPPDTRLVAKSGQASAAEAVDRVALEKLNHLMDTGELWRREGLTIAELAEAAGMPEYRLRNLINAQLGFRNFPSFINSRRIEFAKKMLLDPARSRVTVATIAFDLGFGSLGPFNRAFKQATGVTPTEFRRLQGIADS